MTSETSNKKKSFVKKLLIFLSLIIFAYLGLKYLNSIKQEDGVQNQVPDLSKVDYENFKSADKKQNYDLSEITVSEMHERGVEFIYQILIRNQVQIESLKGDVRNLQEEILKYKSHDKIGKMILSYVKFREKALRGEPYNEELRSFEIISIGDKTLRMLNANLRARLVNFSSNEVLVNDFSNLIPELIAIRNYGDGDDFLAKLRRNISKLITIRRVDAINRDDIDAATLKVERLLADQEYVKSLEVLKLLEERYQFAMQHFLAKLQNRIDVEKTDAEILKYLENLTN